MNKVMASNSKMDETDELLLVVTPHVVNLSPGQSTEVWLPKKGHSKDRWPRPALFCSVIPRSEATRNLIVVADAKNLDLSLRSG